MSVLQRKLSNAKLIEIKEIFKYVIHFFLKIFIEFP